MAIFKALIMMRYLHILEVFIRNCHEALWNTCVKFTLKLSCFLPLKPCDNDNNKSVTCAPSIYTGSNSMPF